MRNTVKSKTDIEDLFNNGARVKTRGVVVIAGPAKEGRGQHGRVAFIAGKKLGTAPQRSYAKRVMRHIAQELGGPWNGFDVVFLARKPILDMQFESLKGDCRYAVEKAIGRQQSRE